MPEFGDWYGNLPVSALEQAFGNMEDLVGRAVLSSAHLMGQPDAILTTGDEQFGTAESDQALQQIWSTPLDWAPSDQAALLSTSAKASHPNMRRIGKPPFV